jgi:NADPH-dependent 2,4-dienoyl-CoA reductase/sulfur reductase-like enzyme
VPNSYYGHGQFREYGKAAKVDLESQERRIAVLFSGRVNDPVVAEELLRDGYCDLIGMVRAGIADPEFANKAREGRLSEIRRCISCTRCIDEASEPRTYPYSPTCSINPVIGNEVKWEQTYKPTDDPKHVVVVGGGLAGTEAARVAAMRGHKVTLLERGKRLGGQMLLAMATPGRDDFEDQVYFEENEMERLGVEVRLEAKADAAAIKALKPDTVVVATGSVPRVPSGIPGLDLPHVVQAWDVLAGKATVGDRVAIVSQEDYYETPCVAEYLAQRGKHVEVFHKSVHLGFEIARYSVGMVLRRMEECGVTIHPNLVLKAVTPDALELRSSFGETTYRKEGFDTVVLVYGSVPHPDLYEQLKAEGTIPQLFIAGSAWLPRFMAEAARHGASIGLVI